MKMNKALLLATMCTGALTTGFSYATDAPQVAVQAVPQYKPSSRHIDPIAITTNLYGASTLAPNALGIGEIAPDFTLPDSLGGEYSLSTTLSDGPVAIIFYRGHW